MFCELEWNGKRYVAIGDHLAMTTSLDGHRGLILNSKDGLGWSVSPTSNTRAGLNQVVWDGKKYVAAGDNETIIYSSDGVDWEVGL